MNLNILVSTNCKSDSKTYFYCYFQILTDKVSSRTIWNPRWHDGAVWSTETTETLYVNWQ